MILFLPQNASVRQTAVEPYHILCFAFSLGQTKWLVVVVICFAPAVSVPRGQDPVDAKLAQQGIVFKEICFSGLRSSLPGHICSKLTTSLVNHSLKFQIHV